MTQKNTVIYKSKILLESGILDGYLSVCGGVIEYVGTERPMGEICEISDGIITPGFIDIHCHSSNKNCASEDPIEVANFHLSHGTTTMLLSYYRDIPHERLLSCLESTKEAMSKCKNLYGAHLEGPYLNANLGAGYGKNDSPDMERCEEYIKTGVVRQWTSAPEINGVVELIRHISDCGIVPAIGHSEAGYERVKAAYDAGARIATHIFNATKSAKSAYAGTLEVDFNEACMLMDGIFCEVICDSKWIHVRREKLQLLLNSVGIDRVVAITDINAAGVPDDGMDVSLVNGELSGTKLTMDRVAKNLYNGGFSLPEIFKMTSLNPARALGLFDRGVIRKGMRADLILIKENAEFIKVL
ncbi:MAG: hypothetical protein E7667_07140 [Ruminococcaceae bacterium]|nr:hypothetical protein [Oscillospiraceae bacterium]